MENRLSTVKAMVLGNLMGLLRMGPFVSVPHVPASHQPKAYTGYHRSQPKLRLLARRRNDFSGRK